MKYLSRISLATLGYLMMQGVGFAQKPETVLKRQLILPGESHTFTTLKRVAKFSPDAERTYFWYKNNVIHQTQGGYDGYLLQDEYTIYFTNHDLKEKGIFKKGLKHGEWRTWYANGKLKEITTWKEGKTEGKCFYYDSTGMISFTGHYRNGLKHGRFEYYFNNVISFRERYKKDRPVYAKLRKRKEAVPADSVQITTIDSLPQLKSSTGKFNWFKKRSISDSALVAEPKAEKIKAPKKEKVKKEPVKTKAEEPVKEKAETPTQEKSTGRPKKKTEK